MKRLKLKKRHLILLFISCFSISCGVYDLSRWHQSETNTYPVSEGYQDLEYVKSITKSKEYIKTIPSKLNVPSFSVAVGINGKLIWSEAVGYSDLEKKTPATTETLYRIGSTSKAVTSTLVARLYEENKFDLDKNLNGFISNYPTKKWDFNARHLLSHTAGFPDYKDLKLGGLYRTICNCKSFKNVTEALKVFNKVELLYEPGTKYSYNSFDIVLVSAYIEKITGENFLDVLNNQILSPLTMKNTQGDHVEDKSQPNTVFYESKSRNRFREWKTFSFLFKDIDLSYKWAGGGLLSTPTDLVKMGNAILTDSTFISDETKAIFFEQQKLSNGELNTDNYALGWRTDKEYDDKKFNNKIWIVHHGGVSKGSMNFLLLLPEYDFVIDASINSRTENFGYLWGEVMQIASFFINEYENEEEQK
ncbi:serine hydrolase domain-containing protein [Muricauda sp. ANG21]|uniref:serine hydrolase domain-containing protein n=1 Tax=Allomuricauda sp. ANG21 TaxID=3042468 RepID=UPI003451490A